MTEQKRLAIEWACARLVALYANLNDAQRWPELAALYAADGIMTRPSDPEREIRGREAILAAFTARPPRTTRHVCSNVVIEVEDADHATGTSAMVLYTGMAPPAVGSFDDRFVRTGDGWRFAARRGTMIFAA